MLRCQLVCTMVRHLGLWQLPKAAMWKCTTMHSSLFCSQQTCRLAHVASCSMERASCLRICCWCSCPALPAACLLLLQGIDSVTDCVMRHISCSQKQLQHLSLRRYAPHQYSACTRTVLFAASFLGARGRVVPRLPCSSQLAGLCAVLHALPGQLLVAALPHHSLPVLHGHTRCWLMSLLHDADSHYRYCCCCCCCCLCGPCAVVTA
jgi:hypothetical protein